MVPVIFELGQEFLEIDKGVIVHFFIILGSPRKLDDLSRPTLGCEILREVSSQSKFKDVFEPPSELDKAHGPLEIAGLHRC